MASAKPSALVDTRVIYCGDNLEQLKKLPDAYVDLIYIDPPFNSNRNYEVFWGETKEKRAFEDRHANTEPLHHLNSHALRWAGLRATIAAGNLHNSMLTKFIAAVFCFCSIFALAEEKPVMNIHAAMMESTCKISGDGSMGTGFILGKPIPKEENQFHSHPIGGKENGLEKSVCPVTRQG